jgi:hypothetical protein
MLKIIHIYGGTPEKKTRQVNAHLAATIKQVHKMLLYLNMTTKNRTTKLLFNFILITPLNILFK